MIKALILHEVLGLLLFIRYVPVTTRQIF